MPELPVDPYSEKSFCYRLEGEGFMLYSVGPNGRDDAGRSDGEADGHFQSEVDDITLHVPPRLPSREMD